MVDHSLTGRVALVTGVSRPGQIGEAIVRRLDEAGAVVAATGWPPHDEEMPWGGGDIDLPVEVGRHDLASPEAPGRLVDQVIERHGRLDIVVAAHARSATGRLGEVDAADLDLAWSTNVRSVVLLAQRFAAVHSPAPDGATPTGRMLWFTSGQHLGPMAGEIPYAVSKGALHQMTATIAAALAERRIIANCINPGPVDTGYAVGDVHEQVAAMFPDGVWGTPDNVADLVAFLLSDRGAWIRGQVLDSEGGFDRFARVD